MNNPQDQLSTTQTHAHNLQVYWFLANSSQVLRLDERGGIRLKKLKANIDQLARDAAFFAVVERQTASGYHLSFLFVEEKDAKSAMLVLRRFATQATEAVVSQPRLEEDSPCFWPTSERLETPATSDSRLFYPATLDPHASGFEPNMIHKLATTRLDDFDALVCTLPNPQAGLYPTNEGLTAPVAHGPTVEALTASLNSVDLSASPPLDLSFIYQQAVLPPSPFLPSLPSVPSKRRRLNDAGHCPQPTTSAPSDFPADTFDPMDLDERSTTPTHPPRPWFSERTAPQTSDEPPNPSSPPLPPKTDDSPPPRKPCYRLPLVMISTNDISIEGVGDQVPWQSELRLSSMYGSPGEKSKSGKTVAAVGTMRRRTVKVIVSDVFQPSTVRLVQRVYVARMPGSNNMWNIDVCFPPHVVQRLMDHDEEGWMEREEEWQQRTREVFDEGEKEPWIRALEMVAAQ